MSESRIHLMAFEPRRDVLTTVYTVGLPAELQEALFELMPPRNPEACLPTNSLKDDLRCWLDQAVDLRKVCRGCSVEDWLVALVPIDLEKLCNTVAVWVATTCGEDQQALPAYKKVMSLLKPEIFATCLAERDLCLFDEQGRPNKDCESLVFSAFSAQVANALVGKLLYLQNGAAVRFNRISRGTKGEYELMSDVRWHNDDPWAFVLRFHVETLPVNRRARLNLDINVRRFISGIWQDGQPYLSKSVNAFVRTDNGTFRVVPYRYSRAAGGLDWDAKAKKNYEFMAAGKLPSVSDYLSRIEAFAHRESVPQILSPHSAFTSWAKDSGVKNGVSIKDKAVLFDAVAAELSDFVEPVAPLDSVQLANLKTAYDDAKESEWRDQEDLAEEKHEKWAAANRASLAKSTGESEVLFQLIGSAADESQLRAVREEIIYFLGAEGQVGGLDLKIEILTQDELLRPLDKSGDAAKKIRMRIAESTLGKAKGLTACIVILPDADAFGKKRGGGASLADPKEAIRMGLARSGRLSQFLVPGEDDSAGFRNRAAVLDLMRQMGFVPEYAVTRRGVDITLPVVGLRVYNSPNDKKNVRFPIAVRTDIDKGLITVDCPLFAGASKPYWQASLELASLSTASSFKTTAEKQADGMALKRMVDNIAAEAMDQETLLLVQACGCIRWRDWWPGLSDAGLEEGSLYYGPKKFESPLDLHGSKLQVLRVRSGSDGEVPDYFTDPDEQDEEIEEGELPKRKTKQGLFVMDGYALALTSRPGSKQYKNSHYFSKFDAPGMLFNEKTLNEYCLLNSDDMDLTAEYAKYAEALRANMVQLYKSDMRVNLPAPLHLAEKLEEYIWGEDKRS